MSDYDTISRLDIIIQQNNQIIAGLQALVTQNENKNQAKTEKNIVEKKTSKKNLEEDEEILEEFEEENRAL